MFTLLSLFVFLTNSASVPLPAQASCENASLTVSSVNETLNKVDSAIQPVAPPIDHKGRPNCRAQTVCFEDEAEDIAYPTQLIADAVVRLRSRQPNSSDGDFVVEHDTNLTPPPLPDHHRHMHSAERAPERTTVSKNQSADDDSNTISGVSSNNHSRPSNTREWPACKAANFHFPIKAALTEDGQWKYIVNNENYLQVVTGSICTDEGSSCDAFRFSLTIRSTCRQNYMRYSLVALDPENKEPVEEKFLIPSACVCTLKWTMIE